MDHSKKDQFTGGNTFQYINQTFNIQTVGNLNPAATKVENTYNIYGTRERVKTSTDPRDMSALRQQILSYVGSLKGLVSSVWKSRYTRMWNDILDLDVVSVEVYEPGRQQGTNFNRNLVANIIHNLGSRGIYGDSKNYNAAQFAEMLESSKEHSVRAALGVDPSQKIVSRLDRYFEYLDV